MNTCRNVLGWLVISSSLMFAQEIGFDKSSKEYLSRLETSGTSSVFSDCRTDNGEAVLIFSLDGQPGRLFELENGEIVNSAVVALKNGDLKVDVNETHGGIYSYTVLINHAKDLIRQPFEFLRPTEVMRILREKSKAYCVNKPPR
jgi:hypothetical protein